MSSIPVTLVAGEAGLLAEENAQRLLSIFMEAGMSCLVQLRTVVDTQLKAKSRDDALFNKYYRSGLASIAQWPSAMVRGEIADIEAHYPELQKLHQFVFISVMSEAAYASAMENFTVPPVFDAYHGFLKRLVGEADVQRGGSFLELPLIYRKVVFVEAFRNAYHDLAQKHYITPPGFTDRTTAKKASLPATPSTSGRGEQESVAPSASQSDEGSREGRKSRLHDAIAAASKDPVLKNGEKSVLLLHSPGTLLRADEAGDSKRDEVPAQAPEEDAEAAKHPRSVLQEGINQLTNSQQLQRQSKGEQGSEES